MKRAQIAIEYLLITGFVILLLIPTVYFLVEYSQSAREDVAESQLQRIGTEIITNAESVLYFGKYSKITVDVQMPEGLDDMYIQCNKEKTFCEFVFQTLKDEIVFSTKFPFVGRQLKLPAADDRWYYSFDARIIRSGQKKFVLETKVDAYVDNSTLEVPCSSGIAGDSGTEFCENILHGRCEFSNNRELCEFLPLGCSSDDICSQFGAECKDGFCTYDNVFVELHVE